MERAYKFRIYPTAEQTEKIEKTFGCVRYVFNYFLNERIEQYKATGKMPTRNEQQKSLTTLKQQLEWLKEPDKYALQIALKNLDTAYRNFFSKVKKGENFGFPKFKNKRCKKQKYQTAFTNNNIKILNNAVQLPKLGAVKCRISKKVTGRILSATVSRNPSGKYFVSLCCTDVNIQHLPPTGNNIGIDLGIKDFAVTNTGTHYQNHKYLAKSEKKLKRLCRELSRKSKGSNNRERNRIRLARTYEHIVNQRLDMLHKLSAELVRKYDIISVETLSLQNMMKNHRLAKSISDVSWNEFIRQLKYKCEWYGKQLIQIDRFFPSSQICSICGAVNPITKNLNVRKWTCTCGAKLDRDENAAQNILNEGLRLLA